MTATLQPASAPKQVQILQDRIRQPGLPSVKQEAVRRVAFSSMPLRWLAMLAILFVAVSWSTTYSVTKGATSGVSPQVFVTLRFGIGAVVLLIGAAARRQLRRPSRQEWKWGLLSGAVFSVAQVCQVQALQLIASGRAGFLISLYSMFTPILAWLLLRQKLTRRELLMFALAVTGIVILTYAPGNNLLGDLLALGTALSLGLLVVTLSRIPQEVDRGFVALIQVATVAAICLVLSATISPGGLSGFTQISSSSLVAAVYLGIVATGLAVSFQAWGQRLVSPSKTALILATEIPLAVLIGVIFRGETFTPMAMLGCGLVLSGTWITMIRDAAATRSQSFRIANRLAFLRSQWSEMNDQR